MGCISTKDSDIAIPNEFKVSQKIADIVYVPQYSALYNLLRKRNDIEIIRNFNNQQLLYQGQISLNFNENSSLKHNDVKMLLNFKNVLVVGSYQQGLVSKIKQISTPKCIYLISQQKSKTFLTQFPIFSSAHKKVQPKQIPIMAFNQHQAIKSNRPKESKKIIFVHSQRFKNQQLYKQLKIDFIFQESKAKQNNIISSLSREGINKALYLHASDTRQQKITQILCLFIKKYLNVSQESSKNYLESILPQNKHFQLESLPKSSPNIPFSSNGLVKNSSFSNLNSGTSLTDHFASQLKLLHKQIGSDQSSLVKLERSYNLLVNLLSNIYNNKQSDNFRKIRKTNKQIYEQLTKYQAGVKLLQDVGFISAQEGFYVNNFDVKYLRVYRMDLDVAYKQYLVQLNK